MFETDQYLVRCEWCGSERTVEGYDAAEQFYNDHTDHADRVTIERYPVAEDSEDDESRE